MNIPHIETDKLVSLPGSPFKIAWCSVTPLMARDWLALDYRGADIRGNSPIPSVVFDEEGRLVEGQEVLRAVITRGKPGNVYVTVGLPLEFLSKMVEWAEWAANNSEGVRPRPDVFRLLEAFDGQVEAVK